MSKDLECPYCGNEQDVCHDDGFGYEEDKRHEDYCDSCGKHFVFNTSISFYYEAYKADCLNGEPHNLIRKEHDCVDYILKSAECEDCDYREPDQRIKKEVNNESN